MKVSELIVELQKLPQDSEVILQKDAEGNGYSPLQAVDGEAFYKADSTWSGDVYAAEWTADDCLMDADEFAEMHKGPKCVVLAPVN